MIFDSPLLAPWTGPHGGVPPFDRVDVATFAAALEAGMADHLAAIDAIVAVTDAPSFDNTIAALERAGQPLNRAATLFWTWSSAMSSPELRQIEEAMAPKLSLFRDRIVQNAALFARIQQVYATRDTAGLTAEQRRLVWLTHQQFAKQGASLSDDKKAELSRCNGQLASLYTRFAQNQLGDEEEYALVLEREAELAGLPPAQIDAARAEAERRGLAGKWAIANTRSSMEPFLTASADRSARERGWRIWMGRGDNGNARDNNRIVTEILALRAEKAKLLGYSTFAHWQMAESMAKDPAVALELMLSVWQRARDQFVRDVADAQAIADGDGVRLQPWDYRYYAEKLRQQKYDLDFEQVKPYLQLERLRAAMFWAAEQLYELRFVAVEGLPVYHADMRVYQVVTAGGAHLGYWYFDPYARPGKQSGAWMSAYREQHRLDGGATTTIVSNNANFIKGRDGEAVTVSWDDARTLFHEFGHALHGLLSNVTYPSLSGTNTTRDFVEFPSQFNENYLQTPEVLAFLVNERGEPIPADLLSRIERAQRFNQGFATAEAQASAIVDMRLHLAGDQPIDAKTFETTILAEIGMPAELVMRHRIPAFGHVFSGDGYAAGYYSYLWAEVLDFDAYEAFTEAGSPYDKATAQRLRDTVLSVGNTIDPAEAFRNFRGRDPKPDAFLRAKGF